METRSPACLMFVPCNNKHMECTSGAENGILIYIMLVIYFRVNFACIKLSEIHDAWEVARLFHL